MIVADTKFYRERCQDIHNCPPNHRPEPRGAGEDFAVHPHRRALHRGRRHRGVRQGVARQRVRTMPAKERVPGSDYLTINHLREYLAVFEG